MAVWIPYLELNCNKCSDGQKKIYGCETETTYKDWWEVSTLRLSRCPLKSVNVEIYEYFKAYKRYQKTTYSGACDWMDEPAKLHDVFEIIEREQRIVGNKQKAGNK